MRNRAKCKKCNSIIQSFTLYDYVSCSCGEIAISGGDNALECYANDWKNFIRIEDNGNEKEIKVIDNHESIDSEEQTNTPSKKEMMEMLDHMIKNIERLPQNALTEPVTHSDLLSALLLISEILRSD